MALISLTPLAAIKWTILDLRISPVRYLIKSSSSIAFLCKISALAKIEWVFFFNSIAAKSVDGSAGKKHLFILIGSQLFIQTFTVWLFSESYFLKQTITIIKRKVQFHSFSNSLH